MSIASEITRLQGAKSDLKDAIEGKGVTVPSATKLDGYADLVGAISQGGGTLGTKTITANGTYNASSDGYDGYSKVTANVPNSYSASDEGKVVSNGALVSQTTGYITENGTYTTTTNNEVIANVPNTYSASDEGKVVSSGALVAQTAHADVTPTTSDQTIDTTLNNSLKVKGDADLVAGNIKKDVEIFGITGSYEGSGGYTADDFADKTKPIGAISPTVSVIDDNILYGRTGITSLSSEDVTEVWANAVAYCSNLVSVSLPNLKGIGGHDTGSTSKSGSFQRDSSLTDFYAPKAEWTMANTFANCTALKKIALSACKVLGNQTFVSCTNLEEVDLGGSTLNIQTQYNFRYDSKLNVLILRATSVATLANVNAFSGTPFESGGAGGHIYIPKTLYDALGTGTNDYKAASNWSTIDGYGTITWHAIEGSIYETQHVDGTPISS